MGIPQSALLGNSPIVDKETGLMTQQMTQFAQSLLNRTGGQPGTPMPIGESGDPATPKDGGLVYSKAGALYYIGSSGTITKLANA